jgi:hypothetical protein
MLRAGISELRQAFRLHWSCARNGAQAPARLLLFYAAECGLKLVLLHRRRGLHTDHLPEHLRGSHDLRAMLKELRVGAREIPPLHDPRLHSGGTAIPVHAAHEAWRYGVRLHTQDEGHLVSALQQICSWVQKELAT